MSTPTILDAPRKEIIHYNWGNTDKIMKVIMKVVNKEHLYKQVEKFAERYRGENDSDQKEKLFDLWLWVRQNIPYVADPVGVQDIKHPARTYEDAINGKGSDCKSMTVFVRFVLYIIGVPHHIEFASYHSSGRIQHVFTVAEIGGKEVPIDTVHDRFDSRVKATRTKKIYPDNMTMIREIAGVGNLNIPKRPYFPISNLSDGELDLMTTIRELELVEAVNRRNGFTEAADQQGNILYDFQKVLKSGLHSGFGSVKNKDLNNYLERLKRKDIHSMVSAYSSGFVGNQFEPTQSQFDYCEENARAYANEVLGRPLNAQPRPTDLLPSASWFQEFIKRRENCLLEQEMENVVNEHLIDAGLYFLYDQWNQDNSYNPIIITKQLNQSSWIDTASIVTGLSKDNIRNLIRVGMIEQMINADLSSITPESLKESIHPAITNNGVNGIWAAIETIVKVVVAIVDGVVGMIRNFEKASKSEQAFLSLPDPGASNIKIGKEDFLFPEDTNSNGNEEGGDSGNNDSNGSGFKLDTKTAGLLLGGMFLLTSNNSNNG